ncbi:signal transduction histidine kinase [Streptomyces sp. PvR006]|uniref:HAMP domain-containing histidine kinase n=1 Tax=unclassified Streptomyces TaxID=2593676 RepID=UPI001AE9D6B4|nr:HAMP domain-containing histidine kinase [Streptomyces sp. PvR006]MBP2579710.1 signal transduction histidine kinase [Streptomyces sp. PvR006]
MGRAHPVDLADTARDAVADLAGEARAARVHVTTTLAPAPVAGDPALPARVALNLPANAVRSPPPRAPAGHHRSRRPATPGRPRSGQ